MIYIEEAYSKKTMFLALVIETIIMLLGLLVVYDKYYKRTLISKWNKWRGK